MTQSITNATDFETDHVISISSRGGHKSEYQEMENFVDIAHKTSLAPYVKSLFYDTNSCCCSFELADGVDQYSPIADELLAVAKATIGQFDWFGTVEHGTPLTEL